MVQTRALPKYIQISERLIREIAAGHLADGTRLPPERQMADDLGTSVGTLRKALANLAHKGLLNRVQGSGNYIQQQSGVASVYAFFRLELLRGGGLPTARVLDAARRAKDADLPSFGTSDQAHRIRRLRLLDAHPVAVEEIWLDGAAADRISARDLSDSLYLFYRDALGIVIAGVTDRIGTGDLPDWACGLLHPRTTGFITRISRDDTGRSVEFSRTWFDPGLATYISRLGKG